MGVQHRSARRVLLRLLVATVVVGWLATGCGGSGGSPSAAGPQGTAASGASDAGSPSSSSTGDDSTGFGWVPFGPTDPGDPPPNRWYGPLADHNCTGLTKALTDEPGGSLWAALDALCAAAIGGDQSQWAVAATKAAAAQSSSSDQSDSGTTGCLADAAKALLARALAWHADHPDARPVVTLAKAGQATACPFRITSITLVDADNNPVPGPLQGPIAGGTRLAIHGDGLGSAPTVLVAGHRATILGSAGSGGPVFVATPAVSHPLVARIRVGNEAGQLLAKVDFRYVASAA